MSDADIAWRREVTEALLLLLLAHSPLPDARERAASLRARLGEVERSGDLQARENGR